MTPKILTLLAAFCLFATSVQAVSVDGNISGGIAPTDTVTANAVACTDCVDGSDLADTITLDADLVVEGAANSITVRDSSVTLQGDFTSTGTITTSSTDAGALDVGGGLNIGSGNVALVGTDGKLNGPLSTTILDDLSGANLTSLTAANISAGSLGSGVIASSLAVNAVSSDQISADTIDGVDVADTFTLDADLVTEGAGNSITIRNSSVTIQGDFSSTGTVTIGDASGDVLTMNAASATFVNDTNVSLNGGAGGLNFGVNGAFTTLILDSANGRVGTGGTPTQTGFEAVYTGSNAGFIGVNSDKYIGLFGAGSGSMPALFWDGGTSGDRLRMGPTATYGGSLTEVISIMDTGRVGHNDTSPDCIGVGCIEVLSAASPTGYAVVVSSQNDTTTLFGVRGDGPTLFGLLSDAAPRTNVTAIQAFQLIVNTTPSPDEVCISTGNTAANQWVLLSNMATNCSN